MRILSLLLDDIRAFQRLCEARPAVPESTCPVTERGSPDTTST